jgi:hypothetical protein
MSVTAVRRMGALGAHRGSRERPERTLYDVSARLRFGRYRRPHDGGAAHTGAGVRKPSMEETARKDASCGAAWVIEN